MVLDKAIHKAFRIHNTRWTKAIREIFYFHYLPKLYIGFNSQAIFFLQNGVGGGGRGC